MAILWNSAEGQASGTNLTTANSGGASGDAFSLVTSSGSPTKIFSNATSAHGSQSYQLLGGNGDNVTIQWTVAGDSAGALQAYWYFTAYPDVNFNLMSAYNITNGGAATACINQVGRFLVLDDAGANQYQTATNFVPLHTWLRIDFCVELGATTTTGRFQAALSLGDNLTALATYDSGYTVNTGTVPYTGYRLGKIDSVPNIAAFFLDDPRLNSGATTFIPSFSVAAAAWTGA